jgi:hypothetical protein
MFWWSGNEEVNKMHWIRWEKMKLAKDEGGLGFRDLYSFNLAMLVRQGWRLLQSPESLYAQVLRAKYFPYGDLLSAVLQAGMSYVWRCILKGLNVLKEGIICRVSDGKRVRIFDNLWLPTSSTCRPSRMMKLARLLMSLN